ncbi:hypothetical protein BKA69DRAFT_1049557 [Paraphysoderma sedebokerense]|nr:hypothetical protein BKA69DRAFT_1049557 [Paraphysoderma sedebokerense]
MKLSPEDAPPMESLDEMDMGIGMNDGMAMGMGMSMSGSAAGNNMNSPMSPSDLVAARNKVVGNQGSTSSSNLFTSPSNNHSQPSNLYNKFISATPSSTSSYRQPTQQQPQSLASSSFSTQPSSFSSQPQAQGVQSQSQSYAPTSPHFTPDPAKTVTIFGFNPSQQNSIFQKFSRLGDIVYTDAAGAGKCFLIIMYNSKEAVDRALKLNGSFDDMSIIGVVPYQESHQKPKSPAAVSNTSAGVSTTTNQTFGLTNQPRQQSQYSSPMNTTSSPMASSVSPSQNQMQQNQFLNQQQQQAQQTPVSSTTTKVVYDANIFKRPGAASTSVPSPSSSSGAYSRTLSSPSYRNQNSTGKSNIYPNVPNYSNILSNYNPRGQHPISNRPVQNGGQQVEIAQGQAQQQPQGWADWLKDKVLGW